MKAIVINLQRSRDRRAFMSRQLDALGLDYEFFAAVDGAALSREEVLQSCNQKWAKRHIGRQMLPGEIGCALSHLGVYRKVVDENTPMALVLEDDAQLVPAVVPVLKAFEDRLDPSDSVFCLLSPCAGLSEQGIPLTDEYRMARVTAAAYLSHAYVVTQESARKMLSALFPIVQVADDWGWIRAHAGIELWACDPVLATQPCEEQSESTILGAGEMKSEDLSARWKCWSWWKQKLYCKWWRTVDRVGLGYYFWRKK